MKEVDESEGIENLQDKMEKRRDKDPLNKDLQLSADETLNLLSECEAQRIKIEFLTLELAKAKEQAEVSNKKHEDLLDFTPSGLFSLSKEGVIVGVNNTGTMMFGKEKSLILHSRFDFYISNETKSIFNLFLRKIFASKANQSCEVTLVLGDEPSKFVYLVGHVADGEDNCMVSVLDLTDHKSREAERDETARLILKVNSSGDLHEFMSDITASLQGWSGCEAVGIRLHEGDDFPYFETSGFPGAFVRAENKLCTYGPDGVSELECMCGNILCRRFDPSKPFFTVQGSFWSNNTTDLLATTTDADRQSRTRNRCNSAGYESVALIPLRIGERVFGLLQFNDHRPDRFTPDLISDFEKMADSLSFAIARFKSEEALQESEKRHRKIIETAMDGFLLLDMQGRLHEANETYCRMSGYSEEELLVMSIPDLEVDESLEDIAKRVQRIIVKGEDRFESRHRRKDGIIFDVEISIQYQPEYGGRFVAFVHDITGRKRAEAELREREVQYRNLADSGLALIWTTGIDGLCNYFNDPWLKFTGRTLEQEMGAGWVEGVHPSDKEPCLTTCKYCLDNRTKFDLEFRLRHFSGEYMWFRNIGNPNYNSSGEFIGYIGYCFDVTHDKINEEKLKLFSTAVESAMDGIIIADMEGNVTYANVPGINIFGYNPEEIMNANVASFNTDPELSKKVTEELILTGSWSGESMCVKKNGEQFPANLSISLIKDVRDQPTAMMAIVRDISKDKRAEEELKQAYAELENLHLNLDEAIFSVDIVQNKMIQVSLAHETIFGYSPKEFFENSQLWYEIIIPEDRPIIDAGYPVLFAGKNLQHEYRINHPNGEIRWVEAKIRPTIDANGNLIRIDGIANNITHRKRAEEELSEREERYRNLFNNSEVGMFRSRLDGLEILEINEKYLKILNCTREEVIGKPSINLWADKHDRDKLVEMLTVEGHVMDFECGMLNKQGEVRKCITSLHLYRGEGILEGSILDITDRKKTEEEIIKAKERAEESDRLKSAFLANMSHEIRTPMNGILGFAGLLKEPKLSGDEQKEYISIIEKSGERMLNIINDIINISKVESGQMQVFISETNINEQIEYIYTFFKPEAEKKGIRIFYNNSLRSKEAFVQTDREKVYAILTNLVKNAIKFTRQGSIEIGYEKKGDHLEFYVKDTGRGIPREQIGIIFERFRQVDDSLHRKFEGAGLGLSISKAYVEMLGGKIWVESKFKEGTVFYFTLPYNVEKEEKDLKEHAAPDAGTENQIKNLKILIAEDDELSMVLLIKTLKSNCREILKVRTGIEAVETLRTNPDIDLILMDIQMPEIDGYQATKQIRQFDNNVIIIAQTAFALSGDRDKAIKSGCNDYIAKPINHAHLNELLKKYFLK